MQDFEKLGVFYLGRLFDLEQDKPRDELLLYDSKDLLTHAVCVGMTGSGKTGLCLTLLEEAAIDGIPALVIDPKGDLSNLLLTFPKLTPEDFAPWVHQDDAQRRNLTVEEYAKQQAELWTKGLAEWGQDGARIQRMRDAADFAVYTPGSNAGLRISVLRAFAAPPPSVRADDELLADRVNSTVSGLLALVGIDANPLESREHILLATLLDRAWRGGENLDLAGIIQQIQNPPVTKLGAIDVESFFPSKDRFALAIRLNNLLSAPGFASWLEGEPLDIGGLLHSPTGKPRISIFSIAHLDESQRMFFVSLLLNETLAWMRTQSGTTSLRAILYMDEIFGYFPPVANPPSKKPLLTLLKQARAYGLGIALSTQNPVDLDYKGLSNAGTWFIGRLQTERDKARVIEGLQGASLSGEAHLDPSRLDKTLSALKNRVFLMHNVHEDEPTVFQARWAMSYLSGPLTRDQIKVLMDTEKASVNSATTTVRPAGAGQITSSLPTADSGYSAQPPVLPPQVAQYFVPLRGTCPNGAQLVYLPRVLGIGGVRFADKKLGVDSLQPVCWMAGITEPVGSVDWQDPQTSELTESELETTPRPQALFGSLPSKGVDAKSAAAWQKSLAEAIYRLQTLSVLQSPSLDQYSNPGESERDFRVRLQQAAREKRDEKKADLIKKYDVDIAKLEERHRKALQKLATEKSQMQSHFWDTAISVGATLLQSLLGRKRLSMTTIRKGQTAARSAGRAMKEKGDVTIAEDSVEKIKADCAALDDKLKADIEALQTTIDPLTEKFETVVLRPKKTDISVRLAALAWLPQWKLPDGTLQAAWK